MTIIREGRRIDRVHGAPLTTVAPPVSHRRHNDARSGVAGDLGHRFEGTSRIEDADWIARGLPSLGKQTHYDTRDGNF